MRHILRKINLLLLLVVLWQGVVWWRTTAVFAQGPTPFLARPYYGGGTNGVGLNASLDHKRPYSPNNVGIGTFVRYTGDSAINSNFVCPLLCYDGHSGYDLQLTYLPVVASAPGHVDYAGWDDPTNHENWLGLTMRLNHNNNYSTYYGHLSMVRFETGANIQNWQLGTSGTTGNSTGPHLHFEVRTLYNNGWRVTDIFGWSGAYNDPWHYNDNGTLNPNGPPSYWLWLPYPQREQTAPTPSTIHQVDDGSVNDNNDTFDIACLSGGTNGWGTGTTTNAVNSDLYWTYTEGSGVDCYVNWHPLNLPSTGQYEVEVYVPLWAGVSGQSYTTRAHAARYRIVHANGENTVIVDQHRISYSAGVWTGPGVWVSLGRYNFSQGSPTSQFVQLADTAGFFNTGHPTNPNDPDQNRLLLVDAVRWVRTH